MELQSNCIKVLELSVAWFWQSIETEYLYQVHINLKIKRQCSTLPTSMLIVQIQVHVRLDVTEKRSIQDQFKITTYMDLFLHGRFCTHFKCLYCISDCTHVHGRVQGNLTTTLG